MFTKPLSLIAVYVMTVVNFTIMLTPVVLTSIPFIMMTDYKVRLDGIDLPLLVTRIAILLIFIVSLLMLFYLFFDFIFGFSVKSSLRKCTLHKEGDEYDFLDPIFTQVKMRFSEPFVKLYIKHSSEINAFAIGGLGRKYIVITDGMIKHFRDHTDNQEQFLIALRSIMAHEMSHLINKDFLPALIIIVNQKVTNLVSRILSITLRIVVSIFSFFRINNRIVSSTMIITYNIFNWILTAFNHYIIYSVYEFLRRFVSRSVEYRCDRQSAHAFGGKNMAFALSFFGKYGYFTIFSTHPGTAKRIAKVENIEPRDSKIKAPISSIVSNYIAVMFLVAICLICAKISGVDELVRKYLIANHDEIYYHLRYWWYAVKNFVLYQSKNIL